MVGYRNEIEQKINELAEEIHKSLETEIREGEKITLYYKTSSEMKDLEKFSLPYNSREIAKFLLTYREINLKTDRMDEGEYLSIVLEDDHLFIEFK